MTEDALAGDQLVTIVQVRARHGGSPWVEPVPIEDVACVGKIVQHERLPDGRFNFLLLGCKRVQSGSRDRQPKLYRIAEAGILEDEQPGRLRRTRAGAELIGAVPRSLARRITGLDPDLVRLLHSDLPLGILSDIIAHALDLPAPISRPCSPRPRVDRRVARLLTLLPQTSSDERPASATLSPPLQPQLNGSAVGLIFAMSASYNTGTFGSP